MNDTQEDEYTCEQCKETYTKEWTDEEAALKMWRDYGDYRGPIAVICDDCYQELTSLDIKQEEK